MDTKKIQDILEKEGFRPTVGKDGVVIFKYEGGGYLVDFSADDKNFIRIIFPNFWLTSSDEERGKAVQCANEATMKIKGAKIFVNENRVWGSVELFLPDEDAFGIVLMRSLKALQAAAQLFSNLIKASA